ncbi:hypothetical protein T484DRAFT_1966616 [Baffinella frigidus]|nr:hypothetical protein T484DRAFT_1966616 [Cryptophyta sp. CCMP2293]
MLETLEDLKAEKENLALERDMAVDSLTAVTHQLEAVREELEAMPAGQRSTAAQQELASAQQQVEHAERQKEALQRELENARQNFAAVQRERDVAKRDRDAAKRDGEDARRGLVDGEGARRSLVEAERLLLESHRELAGERAQRRDAGVDDLLEAGKRREALLKQQIAALSEHVHQRGVLGISVNPGPPYTVEDVYELVDETGAICNHRVFVGDEVAAVDGFRIANHEPEEVFPLLMGPPGFCVRSKVDGSVPRTQHVNLRIVGQRE